MLERTIIWGRINVWKARKCIRKSGFNRIYNRDVDTPQEKYEGEILCVETDLPRTGDNINLLTGDNNNYELSNNSNKS